MMQFATFVEHEVRDQEDAGIDPEEQRQTQGAIRVELNFFLHNKLDRQKSDKICHFKAVKHDA